jgi:hypothetical protein
MPVRKSIRDIQNSNTVSDAMPVYPVKETSFKKIDQIKSDDIIYNKVSSTSLKQYDYKKVIRSLSKIKTIYLVVLSIIILGVVMLLFISANSQKDPLEQTKKEAESVKKQFSKHIILPENEQIDIRKITNKMEDPFFKDAEVGDYLIIFYKNRIAYIYSIDKDIIVNAGVVFIDPKTATTTNSSTKKQ